MIRGIVKSVVQGVIQRVSATVWGDGAIDDRELIQHYGYTSRPKAGAEVIFIRQGGQFIVIGSDDRRYRISLAEGEVALYTDEGDKIHLKRNRIIEIIGGEKVIINTKVAEVTATTSATVTSPEVTAVASSRVLLDTPLTHCTGDMSVDGGISCNGTYGASGGNIQTPGDVIDGVRSMAADRAIYNSHTHNDPQGGAVATPNQGM